MDFSITLNKLCVTLYSILYVAAEQHQCPAFKCKFMVLVYVHTHSAAPDSYLLHGISKQDSNAFDSTMFIVTFQFYNF